MTQEVQAYFRNHWQWYQVQTAAWDKDRMGKLLAGPRFPQIWWTNQQNPMNKCSTGRAFETLGTTKSLQTFGLTSLWRDILTPHPKGGFLTPPPRKLTLLAGKSTMNEDVFPIEHGDFPASYVSFWQGRNLFFSWHPGVVKTVFPWCPLGTLRKPIERSIKRFVVFIHTKL